MNFYNEEYEQVLLSCIMWDFKIMADLCIIMKSEYFKNEKNAIIFRTLCEMYKTGLVYDTKVLYEKLKEQGNHINIAEIGLIEGLTYSGANYMFYVNKLKELYINRVLYTLSANLKDHIAQDKNSRDIIDLIEIELVKLNAVSKLSEIKILKDLIVKSVTNLCNSNKEEGVLSGFRNLDVITNGFKKGDLIILGARPSIGKTSLAMSMMINMMSQGRKVGFISLEMSEDSIVSRFITLISSITIKTLNDRSFDANSIANLIRLTKYEMEKNLCLCDDQDLNINGIKSQARRMALKEQINILFIDYVGLIRDKDPTKPLWENMNLVSRELKTLAKELQIPVVALSQLNRDAQGLDASLSQIRGSGAFEQDADLVMFVSRDQFTKDDLYETNPPRESVYKNDNPQAINNTNCSRFDMPFLAQEDSKEETDEKELKFCLPPISGYTQDAFLKIAKNRNGPVGTISLIFEPEQMRFREKINS